MYKKIAHSCLFLIFMLISSCGQFSYRANVSQGFIPTAAATANIKIGMSPTEVVKLVGEPTIKNAFYPNKWSYAEIIDLGNNNIITKTLTLTFSNGKLSKINKSI